MNLLKFLPRFREAQRQLDHLAARETWSGESISAYQLEKLNELWQHARTSVAYYHELTKTHDLPNQFSSLDEYSQVMPILGKMQVKADANQFLSLDHVSGRWHRTGGSTGVPTSVFWEYEAHRNVLRSKYRHEQSLGLEIFDKKVFLWGHAESFAPGLSGLKQRFRRPIEDWLRNRLRVSAYDLSDDRLRDGMRQIVRFMPKSLYGYSSAVELLAKVAHEDSVEIPQLEVAILTAEASDIEMRKRVKKRLQCRAVLEYGAAECAFIAGQTLAGDIRVRDDMVLVETVENEVGSYDIVLTILGNKSFPLMRYAIEDSTTSPISRPNSGFSILSDIQGRRNDLLVSRRGRRLHAMLIKHQLEQYPQFRRFSAFQDASGGLKITLETSDAVPRTLRESLQSQLVELLDGFPVTVSQVATIPGNAAGKHRWIQSELFAGGQDQIA